MCECMCMYLSICVYAYVCESMYVQVCVVCVCECICMCKCEYLCERESVWGYVLLRACWGQKTNQLSHSTMWNPENELGSLGLVANALTNWANSLVLTHNIFISEEKIIKKIRANPVKWGISSSLSFIFFNIEVCKYLIPNIFLATNFLPFLRNTEFVKYICEQNF